MTFHNELTWINAVKSKREADFHSRYEKAVEKVLDEVKKPVVHENIIGGRRTIGKKTSPKTSPNDRDIVWGLQQGTSEDVNAAMKAARTAEVWSRPITWTVRSSGRPRLFHRNKFELVPLTLDGGTVTGLRTWAGHRLHEVLC
jgi:hypothetical protein